MHFLSMFVCLLKLPHKLTLCDPNPIHRQQEAENIRSTELHTTQITARFPFSMHSIVRAYICTIDGKCTPDSAAHPKILVHELQMNARTTQRT